MQLCTMSHFLVLASLCWFFGLVSGQTRTVSPKQTLTVQDKLSTPPPQCLDQCGAVFKHAAKCGLSVGVLDQNCLCDKALFMEQGAPCISCLFQQDVASEYRVTLLNAYGGCAELLGGTCFASCQGIDERVGKGCTDTSTSTSTLTPTPTDNKFMHASKLELDHKMKGDYPGAAAGAVTPRSPTPQRNKKEEDYSCFCSPDIKPRIQACVKCRLGYESVRARELEKYILGCDTPAPAPTDGTAQSQSSSSSASPTDSTATRRGTSTVGTQTRTPGPSGTANGGGAEDMTGAGERGRNVPGVRFGWLGEVAVLAGAAIGWALVLDRGMVV